MTLYKSVALCLCLPFLSQAQLSAGYQYNSHDEGFNAIHQTPQAKPSHGGYSWHFNGGSHATGSASGGKYSYQYSFPLRPTGTRPSHSFVSAAGHGPATITKSATDAVIVPSTRVGSEPGNLTKTPLEEVTPVPSSVIPTSRWVTKRSVPQTTKTGSSAEPSVAAATCPSGKVYTVVGGDTCEKIATKDKVPVGKLIAANKLPAACDTLQIGQKLCVPECTPYTVQPGDFCFKVATQFKVELSDLLAANPELNKECTNLPLGGLICIPKPAKQ